MLRCNTDLCFYLLDANTVLNEAAHTTTLFFIYFHFLKESLCYPINFKGMFHNAKSNPMYDGSGTSMAAGSDFDPTARYFHSKDGTAWEPYTKEDNIRIETAFVQWEKAAVCTNPSFEVRFGANATSKKTRLPSVTGFLQVRCRSCALPHPHCTCVHFLQIIRVLK